MNTSARPPSESSAISARTIAIVDDPPSGTAAGAPSGDPARTRLMAALDARGWRCRVTTGLPGAGDCALAFVLARTAGDRAGVRPGIAPALASRTGFRLPATAESLGFCPLPATGERPPTVLMAGGDDRGLMYAILEGARRIELLAPQGAGTTPGAGSPAATSRAVQTLLDLFPASSEAPQRALRSVCIFPHHEALDREWYRSLPFWRWYFDLLALHRFNRFALTFGHQTAYLAPPYPFFVDVPSHPEVQVPGQTAGDREANLELLRAIAHLAVERNIDFTLGVWSQHAYSYGASSVTGLDEHNLASYCGAGMRRMLEACPDISSVQLRVNSESGVHLDEGAVFWRAIFDGVKGCGRPVTLDLRAKGLTEDTIGAGLETGNPVVVDTKFWTEHHGLPYHATLLQEGDRYVRRHSYGDQLRYPDGGPRPYDFLFQLWNLGTNRFLLWADPDWVRRFAASSTLGGAIGFEVCAPLSNKGFGNRGGVWRLFADPGYEFYEWEQQRYWYWYLLFGRLGYSGAADPAVWQREWAARVGPGAAPAVEQALGAASGVLPFLTASHSPSASVFGHWPEKDMGGLIDLYQQVPGSDVAMFASAQDAVEERLQGTTGARETPRHQSATLGRLADDAEAALGTAMADARPADEMATRELRGVSLDVRVQAALARYHAARLVAAEHLAAFYATGDADSLLAARAPAVAGQEAWQRLVELTDGVYQDDLIFGRPDDQDGHWKDSLPYAAHDVARIDAVTDVFRRYGLFDKGFDFGAQLSQRTGTPPMPYLHDYAVERRFTGVGPQSVYDPQTGWGWGGTYGLIAVGAPQLDGKYLRAAAPRPPALPAEFLTCDFVSRHPAAGYDNATFLVDLPDGDHDVVVVLADRSASPAPHGPQTVTLQGRHRLGPVPVPPGEVVELRRRVRVTAGRLDVELSAPPQGDWLITALIVTGVAPHLGHLPPRAVVPGQTVPMRVTVGSPEALGHVTLHYRCDATGPFQATTADAVALAWPDGFRPGAADGGPTVFEAKMAVPATATLLEYYFEAVDGAGTSACWPAGGSATPRRVGAGHSQTAPTVQHEPWRRARAGEPMPIRARVVAGAPLDRVTLFYRNVNQMQTHERLAMADLGDGQFEATIPGSDVTTEWDVMYHIEAVDVLGNATFYPGRGAGTPYIVTVVQRPCPGG